MKNGFSQGEIDKTLFIKRKGEYFLIIQVFVDDIIFGATNISMSRIFKFDD